MQTTTIHNLAASAPRIGLMMWGVVFAYALVSWAVA